MTEYDAIEIIKYYFPKKKVLDCGIFVEVNDRDSALGCALEEAVSALYEIKQYREIGTVEECREAREKQTPKKPVKDKYHHNCCPNCGWIVSGEGGYGEEFCPHCENCGQAIWWNDENLEGMEDESSAI